MAAVLLLQVAAGPAPIPYVAALRCRAWATVMGNLVSPVDAASYGRFWIRRSNRLGRAQGLNRDEVAAQVAPASDNVPERDIGAGECERGWVMSTRPSRH